MPCVAGSIRKGRVGSFDLREGVTVKRKATPGVAVPRLKSSLEGLTSLLRRGAAREQPPAGRKSHAVMFHYDPLANCRNATENPCKNMGQKGNVGQNLTV